ncbi:MAG TPA: ATP-binding protein [Opitutaceae bacterium]|nr:ATP-binding protein [Opitutaceae bacterium]
MHLRGAFMALACTILFVLMDTLRAENARPVAPIRPPAAAQTATGARRADAAGNAAAHGVLARPRVSLAVPMAVTVPRAALAWELGAFGAMGMCIVLVLQCAWSQRRQTRHLERVVSKRTMELQESNGQLRHQIDETSRTAEALRASEQRYRDLATELDRRIAERTAELRALNQELQQREVLFRLIFEHAPVGIFWKRADLGQGYHFNPTFGRITMLGGSTLSHFTLPDLLVHPDDASPLAESRRRMGSGAVESYGLELRLLLPDARVVWTSLSATIVRDETGRITQEIGIIEDITARKRAEKELAQSYKDLVETSRRAGMAEVATGVLHNVGNVLNSVNVSSTLVAEEIRNLRVESLGKVAGLLAEHAPDLGEYITRDAKGRLVPQFLSSLAEQLTADRQRILQELDSMQTYINHIKDIVTTQQEYAMVVGVVEAVNPAALMDDALRMNAPTLSRHDVKIVREFLPAPDVRVEKSKVLQVLTNLIRNADRACADTGRPDRMIVAAIEPDGTDRVRMIIRDNGVGIPEANLSRIFAHGFTTRSDGHGFGLHASAIAARAMSGALKAHSDGPGRGATFVLELPVAPLRTATGSTGHTTQPWSDNPRVETTA